VAGTCLLFLLSAGCPARQTRTAPFRARPDSVEPGKLTGPFDGKVVDAATGRPIDGAMVYATWTLENGYGLTQPAGFREFVTSTDAGGNYRVPAFARVRPTAGAAPARGGRLTGFHLVVYKRGFVGYRSDRRFGDLGPRFDFAQRANRIALERWRSDYSHARHIRYLGGGPTISSLTGWEAVDAAAELSGEGAGPRVDTDLVAPRPAHLVAAQLLTVEQVKEITGYDGSFETGPLGDEPDTAAYSSQHFKAMGRPESYDLAVRLWLLDPGGAQQRYEELVGSLPEVEETNEIANRSLRAREGDITGVAFLDGNRGMVVLLTCGQAQCASVDAAVALGRKMFENAQALLPSALGGRP
jgi:hypothetical protein